MKKVLCFLVASLIVIILIFIMYHFTSLDGYSVSFDKCVDGDTAWFISNGKRMKVRFIGINAPEIAHDDVKAEEFGYESLNYVCDKLKNGKNIYLKLDANSDQYDKYDRLIAWVFVDGENLNRLLVLNGYAKVDYVYGNYLYLNDLCDAENTAYQRHIGIWSRSDTIMKNYCRKES